MPLPLTVSCFSKIQIGFTFLVPAHPGSPGKRAVKWVCVQQQFKLQHIKVRQFLVNRSTVNFNTDKHSVKHRKNLKLSDLVWDTKSNQSWVLPDVSKLVGLVTIFIFIYSKKQSVMTSVSVASLRLLNSRYYRIAWVKDSDNVILQYVLKQNSLWDRQPSAVVQYVLIYW